MVSKRGRCFGFNARCSDGSAVFVGANPGVSGRGSGKGGSECMGCAAEGSTWAVRRASWAQ
eukprot:360685-Chlamydomonas_euryale.AAC.12